MHNVFLLWKMLIIKYNAVIIDMIFKMRAGDDKQMIT